MWTLNAVYSKQAVFSIVCHSPLEIREVQDAKGLLDHLAHHPTNEDLIPLRATVGFGGFKSWS